MSCFQIAVFVFGTGTTGAHDLDVVRRIELAVLIAVMNAGVCIGDVAGSADCKAVCYTVDLFGCSIFFSFLCDFHRSDTGKGVFNIQAVGSADVICGTGIAGKCTPACGNDNAVVKTSLAVCHDIQ